MYLRIRVSWNHVSRGLKLYIGSQFAYVAASRYATWEWDMPLLVIGLFIFAVVMNSISPYVETWAKKVELETYLICLQCPLWISANPTAVLTNILAV
jgi:hypothetical protein